MDTQDPHGPPPAEAASAEIRLKGHLGHLTAQEDSALVEFKKLAAAAGFYRPTTEKSQASHDDGTLVRYLRARKFVPQDAFIQFKDTEIWRKDNDLDALYEKIDIHDYQEARSVYPQWTGRRDRRGVPVYLYEVGKLDSKKMVAYSSATSKSKVKGPSPSRMLRLFALYENLTRFVMPLCSAVPGRPNPETPVDQSNNIVDISKVGLKQFWNLKSHMQDASTLATAHYPETLDRIFIIGAPSFFPTVWGWIKKWFDPITTSKIFILSQHQVLPTLESFMDIENIPRKYGGQLDFECGKLPVLDSQVRDCLSIAGGPDAEKLFLSAPVRWMDETEDGEMTALGVGSIDGKPRKEPVATLHSLAVRIATNSSRKHPQTPGLQTAGAPLDRPPAHFDEATKPLHPFTQDTTTSLNNTSQPSTTNSSIQPVPVINSQPAPLHDQSVPAAGPPQQSFSQQNGGPMQYPTPQQTTGPQQYPVPQQSSGVPQYPPQQQNGGPPESINIPPRPTQIERMETQYVTPPSDPSEMKRLG